MRNGWVEKKLGEICEISSKLVDPREPEFINLPHIGAGNMISGTGELIDIKTAKTEGLKSGKFLFDRTMVLYSKIRPYLMKAARPEFGGLCSADVYPLLPNTSQLNRDFLFHLLLSREFTEYAIEGSSRVGMPKVNRDHLFNFTTYLPPVHEQKRIVSIVDEAFEGIDRAIANTQKNLTNARELFESYLNAIFTQKGDGWEEKTLREVSLEFGRGKSKHRPRNDPKLYGGPYPFIQTGDVRNCNHFITKNSQFYSEAGLAQSKLWPKGTICITIAANIAETGILGFDACFPDSVIGIVVNHEFTSNDFVEYLLQAVKARIKAKGKGSAQDNINLATFENEKFPFPSLYQQQVIVDKLNQLSSETQRLEAIYQQKLAALTELKQSILQKAFTGELTADTTNQATKAVKEVVAA